MPFCISCGKEISSRAKFCGHCGTPVDHAGTLPPVQVPPQAPPSPPPLTSPPQAPINTPAAPPIPPLVQPDYEPAPFIDTPRSPIPQSLVVPPPPTPSSNVPATVPVSSKNKKVIIAIFAILIVIVGVYVFVLPKISSIQVAGSGISGSTTPSPSITTAPPATTIPTPTPVPTPIPELFPGALSIRTWYNFSSGKTAGQATVYDTWVNGTYLWHNDSDNKWYIQNPQEGNKYLLVFINIVNRGDTRVWYPKSSSIVVHYNNQLYNPDPLHYIPEISGGNTEATPLEIGEVQYRHNLFNTEYVQDYGLSHGTKSDFVYPGESNAIDGYLIYEVPESLTLDKTYVDIVFNGQDRAVWKVG